MRDTDNPSAKTRGAATPVGSASYEPDAPKTAAARRARSRIKRVVSSLLFQSTALAGTFAGFPVPIYSRAYAQTTCSPSSTDSYKFPKYATGLIDIPTTTFTCTISSGATVTTPQYAYGGALTWYSNPANYSQHYGFPPNDGMFGLNISVTNTATIGVTEAAKVSPMISFQGSYLYGTNYFRADRQQSDAIRVISVGGNSNFGQGGKTDDRPDYPGGQGGTVTVINNGAITGAPGSGIYAVSAGGSAYVGAAGGDGGAVSVSTTQNISASGFGIVAISRGGASWGATGGTGGTTTVTVSGDVSSIASTSAGGGILAASYGGNSPNNAVFTGATGGTGGQAGAVTLTLGSSSTPFAGSVTTTSSGRVGHDWGFFTRTTGAALAAISYGGQGTVTNNGSGAGFDGGDGNTVTLKVYGTPDTVLKTSGDYSVGVLAASYGGTSLDYYDASKSGGGADTATVSLSGGGAIQTAGNHSSGIVAVSLGGLGNLSSTATSNGAGKGGVAGDVKVTNDFAVTTKGDHAHGIAAISAGAGGGIFVWSKNSSFQWGDGNPASNTSSTVNVTNTGAIKTYGVDSHGIIAQSIGGGGGALTSYSDVSTDSYGAVTTSSPTQTVGGPSGSSNAYGVTVVNHGAITTTGGYASGSAAKSADGTNVDVGGGIAILAQSIGGGGGDNTGHGAIGGIGGSGKAGGRGSNGGTTYVRNYAALTTYGSEAHGIVAQSIGGGGGTGRNRKGLFVAVGGSGGSGGSGNTVYVLNEAAITLSGDYATGIVAQSIGGGGGAGGKATAWGVGFSDAIGGTGGGGGAGAEAKVVTSSASSITTSGTNGVGILVQSIGGGGGSGGAAKSSSVGRTFDISIASGGNGAQGGDGGTAYVKHGGSILTSGYDSTGVIVQSIGGGGGQGGVSTAHSLAVGLPFDEKGDSLALSVSISHGGSGAAGGQGGEAKVILEKGSSVTTAGDGSIGLHVQSIGGGGGAGGDSTAAAATATLQSVVDKLTAGQTEAEGDSVTTQLKFALGGSGGAGGRGGKAYAHTYGAISTSGDFADGMLIQSIGGGGGAGGTGETDSVSTFGDSTFSLALSIGGTAGDGGYGGEAIGGVADTGSVSTTGSNSVGLVVHSIGGGGGKGGGGSGDNDADNQLTVGVGATGGSGGAGGSVYAWNNGTITTQGDASGGIIAQSIGGGGGQGGSGTSSIGHAFEFKKETEKSFKDWVKLHPGFNVTTTLTANTGASGGAGGDGGDVVVGAAKLGGTLSKGTTTTSGSFSNGVLAQSIGGGGGAVSVSSSVNDADIDVASADVDLDIATISFGAKGGSYGSGGSVTVYAANTYTSGFSSNGIIAQSIGGGGGTGITTGYAMDTVKIYLGSNSGDTSSGDLQGGKVTVDTIAGTKIVTSGDNANGIIAQSIGGGGGLAGVALGTYDKVNDDTIADVIEVWLGTTNTGGNFQSLDGDTVTVDHAGAITTSGLRAVGIVAQSIGAGGGFVTASETSIKSMLFWDNQSRGAGYDVSVTLEEGSSITTTGDGGVGIIAQSIGGGGGVAADLNAKLYTNYVAASSYNNSQDGRHSSVVKVSVGSGASITTSGAYAHGIIAQSVAGSGGIFEKNGKTYAGSLHRNGTNSEASVTVTVDGSVSVTSGTAWGIWAQTQDTTVTVTVGSSGSVSGTTSSDVNGGAIFAALDTGGTATLTNSGTVSGNVVKNIAGKETWSQDYSASPSADSSVRLSGTPLAGQALFANQGTGTFATGAIADLDTILNTGTISLGGSNRTLKTTVTGDLVGIGTADTGSAFDVGDAGMARSFTPVSYFEGTAEKAWRTATSSRGGLIAGLNVDMEKRTSDQLVVRGDFAGTWGIILNPYAMLPNVRTDFVRVEGADLSDTSILSTLVYRFTDVTTSDTGWKGFEVKSAHFEDTGVAMGANATGVSRGLQSAWNNLADGSATTVDTGDGGPSIAQAFAAFHAATPESFEQMLLVAASETTAAGPAGAPQSAMAAASSVMSCPAFTTGVTLQEGECVWGRFLGSRAEQDAMHGATGFKEQTAGFAAGGQKALGDGWFLGGSLSYEDSWFTNDAGTEKVEANSFTAAAALKKEVGPWLFALAGGAGYTWGESSRYLSLGSLSAVAEADPTSAFAFGRARASYEFAFDERFYMRPMVDLDLITVHQEGYRESGAGGLNLIVDDATKTVFGVTPGVEFGRRFDMSDDLPARLFAGVGVSFLSDDKWATTARFAGITAMDQFTTIMPINDTVGLVTAGIDLQKVHGMQLKLQYDGAFADGYQSHGGSLRFGYRF